MTRTKSIFLCLPSSCCRVRARREEGKDRVKEERKERTKYRKNNKEDEEAGHRRGNERATSESLSHQGVASRGGPPGSLQRAYRGFQKFWRWGVQWPPTLPPNSLSLHCPPLASLLPFPNPSHTLETNEARRERAEGTRGGNKHGESVNTSASRFSPSPLSFLLFSSSSGGTKARLVRLG